MLMRGLKQKYLEEELERSQAIINTGLIYKRMTTKKIKVYILNNYNGN